MQLRKFLFIPIFFALVSLAASSGAEEIRGDLFRKDAPVEITADTVTYDKEKDTYLATGNVEIVQTGTTLKADKARLDMASGIATASGNVTGVDEGGNSLSGNTLQFSLKEKTAVLANGRLYYRQSNIHIVGETIEKTGPETYKAKKLTYTTCDCPPDEEPAWSFTASSANVEVGEFFTGWNARFYIKGVPVLYSPFISIPIKRERQTGFLQPRPGYSRLRGFVLDNSFFWAISESSDATFYLDVNTARGLGKGVEYRYIRSRTSQGQLLAYQFQENSIARVREFRQDSGNLSRPEDASDNRWQVQYQHTEQLANNINIRANINLVSDDEYLLDFGKSSQEKSLESIESNVSVSRNWSVYSLVGQLRLFNNLLDPDDKTTLQRLPEITFTNADKSIYGSPFYLSSSSSLVNFWREEGVKGQRADINPRISLPMRPGGYFDFTPSIAPRATFWLVNNQPGGEYFDRFLYELRADIATTFVNVYQTDFLRLKALRHTIRPSVTYSYIPESVQDDLPNFDAIDRIVAQNSITYELNSTITGKLVDNGTKSYFDYLYLDFRQTYNIFEATRGLTSPLDRRKPFSDLFGEIRLRPSMAISASAKGQFDTYENHFNSYDASIGASDSRGDSFAVSHRYVRGGINGSIGSNYLEGSVRAHVSNAVDLTFLKRFSFDEYRSLETTYGVEYKQQCWSAVLTYAERLDEKIVYLTFNLLGLGRVAGFQGRLEPH